jgi:hypothetical protein
MSSKVSLPILVYTFSIGLATRQAKVQFIM